MKEKFMQFVKDYEQSTNRRFMSPMNLEKTDKIILDKVTNIPRLLRGATTQYGAKDIITIDFIGEEIKEITTNFLKEITIPLSMSPEAQRFQEGYVQTNGIYDDETLEAMLENDSAFENWYSLVGAHRDAALKDNTIEAYATAMHEIEWEQTNWEELFPLIWELAAAGQITYEIRSIHGDTLLEALPCAKVYFKQKPGKKLQVPFFIKQDYLYKWAIEESLKKFITDLWNLITYEDLSLKEKLALGSLREDQIKWDGANGRDLLRVHKLIMTSLRPWLSGIYERKGGDTITMKRAEMIDIRINEYLTDAFEDIKEWESISDGMKLNALTEEENATKLWAFSYPWIQWKLIGFKNTPDVVKTVKTEDKEEDLLEGMI